MGLFDSIATMFGLGYQAVKDQHLTGAQREANAFTSQENLRAMQFSHNEAQEQMAFQERMANTQYQRGVEDMQAAGLNPALAYQNGGAVAPSGAAGSGSAGSSVDPGRGLSMSDLLSALRFKKEMKLLDKQAENLDEDSKKKAAERLRTQIETDWLPKMYSADLDLKVEELDKVSATIAQIVASTEGQKILNEWNPKLFESQLKNDSINRESTIIGIQRVLQEIKNLKAENENILADTNVKMLTQGLVSAQTALAHIEADNVSARTWEQEYENAFKELTGHSSNITPWNAITNILSLGAGKLRSAIQNFGK